jgi:hypothetical protein
MTSLGLGVRFTGGGHGGEIVCGLLGVVVVLAAGTLWRRHSQSAHAEQAA